MCAKHGGFAIIASATNGSLSPIILRFVTSFSSSVALMHARQKPSNISAICSLRLPTSPFFRVSIVGAAEKAVQAKKRGDKGGVKAVFKKQRKELEKAERPRKGVAAELEDDKIRRQQGVEGNNEGEGEVHPETGHDERQVVVEEGSAKPEGKDIPQLIA